jgi:hypothetical protein
MNARAVFLSLTVTMIASCGGPTDVESVKSAINGYPPQARACDGLPVDAGALYYYNSVNGACMLWYTNPGGSAVSFVLNNYPTAFTADTLIIGPNTILDAVSGSNTLHLHTTYLTTPLTGAQADLLRGGQVTISMPPTAQLPQLTPAKHGTSSYWLRTGGGFSTGQGCGSGIAICNQAWNISTGYRGMCECSPDGTTSDRLIDLFDYNWAHNVGDSMSEPISIYKVAGQYSSCGQTAGPPPGPTCPHGTLYTGGLGPFSGLHQFAATDNVQWLQSPAATN